MKNKIISISNELNACLDKNMVLKNKIDAHVCHASVASSSSLPNACFGDKESCFFGFGNNPLLPFIMFTCFPCLVISMKMPC